MKHELKTLEKSQVEFTITVEPAEYEKHMKNAAVRISERTASKGFRKGKAPYAVIAKAVGEMNILNEALEKIIQETFYKAVKEEGIETVGMPEVDVDKIAPGNDLVYKAKVALLPKLELADMSKIKVKHEVKPVDDKQVNEVLENLTKMQAKEVIKVGKARKEDVVVVDMNLFMDNVPVEGGQALDYKVYLSEDQYIPGFADALVGLAKDDEKEFVLPFPKEYFQKNLAGKDGTFKIKVKEVYERTFPKVDDEFAKNLGQKDLVGLKELLKKNLTAEAEKKADERAEIEIFDTLIEKSTFDTIPEVLIDAERKKMFFELQRDLERNGVSIEQYLADIKKKEEELFEDFKKQATKRAQAALLSRQVAKDNKIEVSDEELDGEIKLMEVTYKDTPEYMENLKKPEVRETVKNMLVNKKVIAFLKDKILEKPLNTAKEDKTSETKPE